MSRHFFTLDGTVNMDEAAIGRAAELLVVARRTGRRLERLPASCSPATLDDALAIQDATVAALGESIAGWKVSIVDGRAVRGVLVGSRVFDDGARIEAARMPLLGVEAEIAFRFARDLAPGRYSYAEVADAVTAFAAIEIVDSRFSTYPDLPIMDRNADCVSNGGFVCGPAAAEWRKLDLKEIAVTLTIGGTEIARRNGGHPAVDPLLPAVALVNELPGGAKAGQIVTTGTYTGLNFAKPGQKVTATFAGFGAVEVSFV
jgi:2-keto-4-pentenoate hydratase